MSVLFREIYDMGRLYWEVHIFNAAANTKSMSLFELWVLKGKCKSLNYDIVLSNKLMVSVEVDLFVEVFPN